MFQGVDLGLWKVRQGEEAPFPQQFGENEEMPSDWLFLDLLVLGLNAFSA